MADKTYAKDIKNRLSVNEIFTDRENERAVFWRHYRELEDEYENKAFNESPHLINYYGEVGIGKSTLLQKIKRELLERDKKAHCILIQMQNTDAVERLFIRKLVREFTDEIGISFKTTEQILKRLSRTLDGIKEDDNLSSKISESAVIGAINIASPFMGGIPGAIASGVSSAADIAEKAEQIFGINFLNLASDLAGGKLFELKSRIENASVQDLENFMPAVFLKELEDGIKKQKKPVVVMLDTYEFLINPLSKDPVFIERDILLRRQKTGLIGGVKGILWVIAGRFSLSAIKRSKDDNAWDKLNPDEHLIGLLSMEDRLDYLEYAGIDDEELRNHIAKITNGLPMHLHLCVKQYYDTEGNKEKQLAKSTYADSLDLAFDRYFQRMQNDNTGNLAAVLSLFDDGWTDEMIDSISPRLPYYDNSAYHRLKRDTSIIKFDEKRQVYSVERNAKKVFSNLVGEYEKKKTWSLIKEYISSHEMEKEEDEEDMLSRMMKLTALGLNDFSLDEFISKHYSRISYCIDALLLTEADALLLEWENSKEYRERKPYDVFALITSARLTWLLLKYATVKDYQIPEYSMDRLNECRADVRYAVMTARTRIKVFKGKLEEAIADSSQLFAMAKKEFGKTSVESFNAAILMISALLVLQKYNEALSLCNILENEYKDNPYIDKSKLSMVTRICKQNADETYQFDTDDDCSTENQQGNHLDVIGYKASCFLDDLYDMSNEEAKAALEEIETLISRIDGFNMALLKLVWLCCQIAYSDYIEEDKALLKSLIAEFIYLVSDYQDDDIIINGPALPFISFIIEILKDNEEFEDAYKLAVMYVNKIQRIYGEDNDDVLEAYLQLGNIEFETDKVEDAFNHHMHVYRKIKGTKSPFMIETLSSLAYDYYFLDKQMEFIQFIIPQLNELNKYNEVESVSLPIIYEVLARCLYETGDKENSLIFFRMAKELGMKALDPNNKFLIGLENDIRELEKEIGEGK